ncbi:hypothetical protein [Corynebacterium sp. AOP12-C2-36]|uniref:hypothetical protein n=1 Tax=Corynebacterium sp. AOP12-C2-36 TaxID=3457723 RepID=UPI0040334522
MTLDHKTPMTSGFTENPTTAVLFEGKDFTHLQHDPGDGSTEKGAAAMAAAVGAGAGFGLDKLTGGRVGSLSKASPRRALNTYAKKAQRDLAKKTTVEAGKKVVATGARKLGARAAALAVAAAIPGPGWAAAAGIVMTIGMEAVLGGNRILKGLYSMFTSSTKIPSTDTPPSPPTTTWLPLFDPPEQAPDVH